MKISLITLATIGGIVSTTDGGFIQQHIQTLDDATKAAPLAPAAPAPQKGAPAPQKDAPAPQKAAPVKPEAKIEAKVKADK